MDPIALAGSALKILNVVRDQLKDCEAAMEEAKLLNQAMNSFEVTLMMIPTRSTLEEENADGIEDFAQINVTANKGSIGTLEENSNQAKQFVKEKAIENVTNFAENNLGPLMSAIDIFKIGDDCQPLPDDGPSPGSKMKSMKELKDGSGLRIHSDLEVMFSGMSYIIKDAIMAIFECSKVINAMRKVGMPSCMWAIQPWKVQETLGLREQLAGQFSDLKKQQYNLQVAIGVASYAVQLEQLESVLDATSAFQHRDMKLLWKKKIGSDKTKVLMVEFCEAFFSDAAVYKALKEQRSTYSIVEKIGKNKIPAEVSLQRFMNELYNNNNDDYLTVYELAAGLKDLTHQKKISSSGDAVLYTSNKVIAAERSFLSEIKFNFIRVDAGEDGILGTADDKISVLKDGEFIEVRPFHCPLIVAEVRVLNPDQYEYDHLTLLQHIKNPFPEKEARKEFHLVPVATSKCYVIQEMNAELVNEDPRNWNGNSY
jgi:hypothetical protein